MSQYNSTNRSNSIENCYQRGLKLATQEKNYDYAQEMFAQCVLHAPSNVVYAEAMLKNLREKFSGRKKKSTFSFGQGGSRGLKKSLQHSEWTSVLRLGIDLLKANPWDVATLRAMAKACEALHYNEVELVYLKQALDADPKDVEVNCHCARSLGRMGQFDQAIACWHRVETLQGKSEEAARMISQLAEDKLRYPGGIPPAAHAPAPATVAAATESRSSGPTVEPTLTRRQLLERSLADNPQDESTHLELTDLLIASELYDVAEASLKRAVAACGESPPLVKKLEQVRALLADQQQEGVHAKQLADRRMHRELIRVPWLELLLAAAVVGLGLQFFPALGTAVWRAVDVRNWNRVTWFALNVFIVLLLVSVRFAPEMKAAWQEKRRRGSVSGKR
jgi:tetratricopeptide (TPR) repeat protein